MTNVPQNFINEPRCTLRCIASPYGCTTEKPTRIAEQISLYQIWERHEDFMRLGEFRALCEGMFDTFQSARADALANPSSKAVVARVSYEIGAFKFQISRTV